MSHTCPRRRENGMDRVDGPFVGAGQDLDTYEPNHGLVGQPSGCSYCGSMSPDDFMDHVRAGRPIGPTDKSYKVYVHKIPRGGDPGDIRVLSATTHYDPQRHPTDVRVEDLTDAQRQAVIEQWCRGNPDKFSEKPYEAYGFTTWGETVEGKFYTAHLSPEQGHEFWELHLAGDVNWSYPLYRPIYLPGPSDEAAAR